MVDGGSEEKIAFFQGVWNIVESRVGRPVAIYLLLNGAASARVLMMRTGLGASSVYWALDRLASLGIVERGVRVKMPNRKCVTIHRLVGCDPELAQEAGRLLPWTSPRMSSSALCRVFFPARKPSRS